MIKKLTDLVTSLRRVSLKLGSVLFGDLFEQFKPLSSRQQVLQDLREKTFPHGALHKHITSWSFDEVLWWETKKKKKHIHLRYEFTMLILDWDTFEHLLSLTNESQNHTS